MCLLSRTPNNRYRPKPAQEPKDTGHQRGSSSKAAKAAAIYATGIQRGTDAFGAVNTGPASCAARSRVELEIDWVMAEA